MKINFRDDNKNYFLNNINKAKEKKNKLYNDKDFNYNNRKNKLNLNKKDGKYNENILFEQILYCRNIKYIKIKNQNRKIFIWFFIIINIINIVYSENNNRSLEIQNIIYIKVRGNESQKIIRSTELPNLVYINNTEEIEIQKNGLIYIESNSEDINEIKIIWNKKLDNLKNLFYSLESVIEIDLPEFDTSEVTTMENMFYNCNNLIYINFDNINTSLVKDMSFMLYKCYSLTSIDLSNFDTSKITTMYCMFFDCLSLTFLDLSKFNTPVLTNIEYIFY